MKIGRKSYIAILLAVTALPLSSAQATAIFSTFVDTGISIITIVEIPAVGLPTTLTAKPTDLTIAGGVMEFTNHTDANPADKASATNSLGMGFGPVVMNFTSASLVSLDVGDTLDQVQSTNGNSRQPPEAFAEANLVTLGTIQVENLGTSGSTYIVVFDLDYNFNINATQSEPFNDSASAIVSILVETVNNGTELDLAEDTNTETNGGLIPGDDSSVFTMVLEPGQSDAVNTTVRLAGRADSVVPEPTAGALLGLMGLGLLHRRRPVTA